MADAADLPETIKELRARVEDAVSALTQPRTTASSFVRDATSFNAALDALITACLSVSEGAIREAFEAGWEKGYERGPDPYTDYSSLPGDIAAYLSSRQKGSTPA